MPRGCCHASVSTPSFEVAKGSEIVSANTNPQNRSPLKNHGKNRTKNTSSGEIQRIAVFEGQRQLGGSVGQT